MSDKRTDIGWKYYNHAAVPTCAPHEEPDLTPSKSGEIWNIQGKPLLARWTTDFDCGYETNWWYIIKDGPFNIDELDPKVRKHIRQSLKKVEVKLIEPSKYAEELCAVHNRTVASYDSFEAITQSPSMFEEHDQNIDYWAAFNIDNGQIVGYMRCKRNDVYAETLTAKYDPQFLNLRVSDAIHYSVLQYYLNELCYKYVCSGSRSINHKTNAQEYKIKTFGFRKAYCKLHIAYRPHIKLVINVVYPFRGILKKLDKIRIVHKVNSILLMEKIMRTKA